MSKASEALVRWMDETEAQGPEARIPSFKNPELAGGFAALSETDQDRLLQHLVARKHGPDWQSVIAAIGSTKNTSVLESKVLPLWLERSDERMFTGELFVLYALLHGRGTDAARVVNKLRQFTSYPGLAPKLGKVIEDYPLDEELLDLAARALERSTHHIDSEVLWGLSAYLLHSGTARGVTAAFFTFLLPPHEAPGLALRLCDIIDDHARDENTQRWAARTTARLRAIADMYIE